MAGIYSQEMENEPLVRVGDLETVEYVPPPVKDWCACGRCQAWPQVDMNNCCQYHPIWDTRRQPSNIICITDCPNIAELMLSAPLRSTWNGYCAYHVPERPDAEQLIPDGHIFTEAVIQQRKNEQKRLCAYRSLVLWSYPMLRRSERKPLPACVYAMVRAMFPSTDNEDIYADWQHSVFTYEVAGDN